MIRSQIARHQSTLASFTKLLLLLGLIYAWMQILQCMNDLINYDTEPLSSKNVKDHEMELLNNMENMEADKVKYEDRSAQSQEEMGSPLLKRKRGFLDGNY